MKPLNGYIIVNKPVVEEKTSSGIILTGGAEASDVPSKGVVIASDVDFINVDFDKDVVLLQQFLKNNFTNTNF